MTSIPRTLVAALTLICLSTVAPAQVAGKPPSPATAQAPTSTSTSASASAPAPAKRKPPQPAADAAPGGGPDKVWVNLNSGTYHCFGDRYYGKTANGRYMTEAAAKGAGAHGPRGKSCAAAK